MDNRALFINHVVGVLLNQRKVIGVAGWPASIQNAYDLGTERAIGTLMSVTDSRILNGASFRITNTEGKVVEFYPEGSDPKDYTIKGIISEIANQYRDVVDAENEERGRVVAMALQSLVESNPLSSLYPKETKDV